MAEYYPLLAKAVGSLPNSTPEARRVVYERARKALIGQLRTLHPPVPEEDIDRESVALDQAVERLEAELAAGAKPGGSAAAPQLAPPPIAPQPPAAPESATPPVAPAETPPPVRARPASLLPEAAATALAPGERKPLPLRTRLPTRRAATAPAVPEESASLVPDEVPQTPAAVVPDTEPERDMRIVDQAVDLDGPPRVRNEAQRPFAPQAPGAGAPKRRLWIVFAGIAVVVVLVAGAAFKLRQSRETVSNRPVADKAAPSESGKIAERVGGSTEGAAAPDTAPAANDTKAQTNATSAPSNPEVPVAYRAALLVEAPNEPNKVKTFLGTVTWKLTNVGGGPGETVGTAVEADVDLPDDKTKAIVTFEKNTDASLPASHTIKVRFVMQPGSVTGDVQQISVPQLRQEDSPGGDALAGVTVPVIQNSFLVGLSPGAAEQVNLKQLKDQQWIDIPMLLTTGKIAKLTFEKGEAGNRDLAEAMAAWSKS